MLLKKSGYIMGLILLSLSATVSAQVENGIMNGDYVSVPEPSTFILMGIGLAALGFVRRRK